MPATPATPTTPRRTTDRIREEVAFLLDTFDRLDIEPQHVTAGLYLSAQVSGFNREDAARAEVDRVADWLLLAADDGETGNYDRRGPVTIGDRRVVVGIYTGRPAADETPTAVQS